MVPFAWIMHKNYTADSLVLLKHHTRSSSLRHESGLSGASQWGGVGGGCQQTSPSTRFPEPGAFCGVNWSQVSHP